MNDLSPLGADKPSAEVTDVRRTSIGMLLLIAVGFPLAHALIYPFPIFLHPDTTGLVLAGEALANEGRAVQPFRWDYIFEVLEKKTVSGDTEIVDLGQDDRMPGIIYPPGYSWIVAAGISVGLSASQTCLIAFYLTMLSAAFCWLLWAQRMGISRIAILLGLLTVLMSGPATVTDPFGWLAAAFVLTVVTFEFNIWCVIAATIVMTWADLIRHAAILIAIAWFWLWMTRRITVIQRLMIVVSCAIVVTGDLGSKFLRTGGMDPMSLFSGGWPTSVEVVKAFVYALLGGWTPVSVWLKIILVLLAGLGLPGVLLKARKFAMPRWVLDLLIFQSATAFVLCVAQYKYGADFTKAPIAIARYWRYCTPGLICLHLYGLGRVSQALMSRFQADQKSVFRHALSACYALTLMAATLQWVHDSRIKWSGYVEGPDGFSRREATSRVHAELQNRPLLAVLTDNHQRTFTAIEPAKTKSIYGMSGFYSDVDGVIALVTGDGERGRVARAACEDKLQKEDSRQITESIRVDLYHLPAGRTVRFNDHLSPGAETTSADVSFERP
jgi:hypothetical protein